MKKRFIKSYSEFISERNISVPMMGNDVKQIQNALTRTGYELFKYGQDGKFGYETLGQAEYFFHNIETDANLKKRVIQLIKESETEKWNEYFNLPDGKLEYSEELFTINNDTLTDDQQKLLILCSEDKEVAEIMKNIVKERVQKLLSEPIPHKMATFLAKNVPQPDLFLKRLKEICIKIKCDPDDLIRIMYFESGLNPKARNRSTNATGLIQFMPSTCKWLGTTTTELLKMSAIQQLDYVEKYLLETRKTAEKSGRIKASQKLELQDLYLAVFYPSYMGKQGLIADKTSKISIQNPALQNDKGEIHTNDIISNVLKKTEPTLG